MGATRLVRRDDELEVVEQLIPRLDAGHGLRVLPVEHDLFWLRRLVDRA